MNQPAHVVVEKSATNDYQRTVRCTHCGASNLFVLATQEQHDRYLELFIRDHVNCVGREETKT